MACSNCQKISELLAATYWFWVFSLGFVFFSVLSLVIGVYSSFWWTIPLYFAYIVLDRATPEKGGRPIEFIRQMRWWKLMKSYFRHQLVLSSDEGVTSTMFDPTKNYIFACYPHGILPAGPFAAFVHGSRQIFPNHTFFLTALGIQFWVPIIRELFLAVGAISVSAPAIRYVLRKETGGNIVSILIGGGDEAQYSGSGGSYKIILKPRKGFVKMALQMGAPIVPVFTFGEPDIFEQVKFPGLNVIQHVAKQIFQLGFVVPKGKYWICPKRVPLTTVVGKPITIEKTPNPTAEQIDQIHQEFTDSILQLFETNKGKYVKNPEKATLEIV